MIALHYEITLPLDYDMGIVRERVATRGHALDHYAGLGFKAYLIREAGVNGSPVNQYAPFYHWNDPAAMGRFLWGGDGFGGIVRDFGRPSGQTWTTVATGDGDSRGHDPAFATKVTRSLDGFSDPEAAATEIRAALAAQQARPGVHSVVAAIDSRTWESVLFTLWRAVPADEPGDVFQVLHLSTPSTSAASTEPAEPAA